MRLITFNVDTASQRVTAAFGGFFFEATAIFRPGMGCALHIGTPLQRMTPVSLDLRVTIGEASQKSDPDGFTLERPSRKSVPHYIFICRTPSLIMNTCRNP